MALTNSEKKAAQRDRQKAMGEKVVEVLLSTKDQQAANENCKIRGGWRGPYGIGEYIAALIRKKFKRKLKSLGRTKVVTLNYQKAAVVRVLVIINAFILVERETYNFNSDKSLRA